MTPRLKLIVNEILAASHGLEYTILRNTWSVPTSQWALLAETGRDMGVLALFSQVN